MLNNSLLFFVCRLERLSLYRGIGKKAGVSKRREKGGGGGNGLGYEYPFEFILIRKSVIYLRHCIAENWHLCHVQDKERLLGDPNNYCK